MNNYPKVSILLAAYNSDAWIYESMKSILCQTYPNLELILCDDGTENFDTEKIKCFAHSTAPHVPFVLIHQPQNVGTVRNLNAGLAQANGDWIIPFAADDCYASPRAVEQIMGQIQKDDRKWAVARTTLCDERLVPSGKNVPNENTAKHIDEGDVNALYFQLCTNCCLPGGGSVFHAQLLREMGGFDEAYHLTEDWPLFLKLVRHGWMPALSEQNVVLHRFGGVSRKNAGKNVQYQHDLISVLQEEVKPHIDSLNSKDRIAVQKMIRDKKAIYELRFTCPGISKKVLWVFRHPGLICRKVFSRREKIC